MEPAGPATLPEPSAEAAAAPAAPAPCARCGTPLRAEQEWCLNCGAPTATRVAAPSGWKVPVAIVATVLTIAIAGLVIAFLAVSDDNDLGRLAQSATPAQPTPAPPPPPPPPPPPAASPAPTPDAPATDAPAEWPAGKDAFTIVLASTRGRADADRRAKEATRVGTPAGVLDSDDFKSLRPGYYVVFSGQYETSKEAQRALEGLTADAQDPYVRRVTPR